MKKGEKMNLHSGIPITEYIHEAIRDFDNGCFTSSLLLCRRAYEGALVEAYKTKEKREPFAKIKCPHCKKIIRRKAYLGIRKLHKWAVSKGLIKDSLISFGFFLSKKDYAITYGITTHLFVSQLISGAILLLKELNKR